MAKKYKMDNDRFLKTLDKLYEDKPKDSQTIATFIEMLKTEFDKEQDAKTEPLTKEVVKKRYAAANRALQAYAEKHELGKLKLKREMPPEINWAPHYVVVEKKKETPKPKKAKKKKS